MGHETFRRILILRQMYPTPDHYSPQILKAGINLIGVVRAARLTTILTVGRRARTVVRPAINNNWSVEFTSTRGRSSDVRRISPSLNRETWIPRVNRERENWARGIAIESTTV